MEREMGRSRLPMGSGVLVASRNFSLSSAAVDVCGAGWFRPLSHHGRFWAEAAVANAFEKIGVSSRVELLFYLLRQEKFFSDPPCIDESVNQGDLLSKYHRAAEEGFAAAQFALGLAHH